VRGVLVGTPPEVGKYLTMGDLNRVRGAGPKRSYEHLQHRPGILAGLLRDKRPPNVIILMHDTFSGGRPPITPEEVEAAQEFVRRGGRLLALDDWKYYGALVEPCAKAKPLPPPPAPDPKLAERIRQQARLLGADDFRTREKATAELLRLGPQVVPILERLHPTTQEEQSRIQKLLRALRPPAAKAVDEDWLAGLAERVRAAHPGSELKRISRNAQHQPGWALCVHIRAPGKGK
jgi:hypothetical protein